MSPAQSFDEPAASRFPATSRAARLDGAAACVWGAGTSDRAGGAADGWEPVAYPGDTPSDTEVTDGKALEFRSPMM